MLSHLVCHQMECIAGFGQPFTRDTAASTVLSRADCKDDNDTGREVVAKTC